MDVTSGEGQKQIPTTGSGAGGGGKRSADELLGKAWAAPERLPAPQEELPLMNDAQLL